MLRWLAKRLLGRKPAMLRTDDPAPDFQALDHRGETVSLESLRGQRFVLWFYPKADTPG